MSKLILGIVSIAALSSPIFGQLKTVDFQATFRVSISKTTEKIVIDGELNEPIWQQQQPASNFFNKYPTDIGQAAAKTEVRFYYDDNFLYVGATLFDVKDYVVQSLKRDQGLMSNDGFTLVLDPMNQHTNGFLFSINPYNSQTDDLLSGSLGSDSYPSNSWDNKWFSQTKREKDRWFVEMAIPFKTLRYDQNIMLWGINLGRSDKSRNEYHSWTNLPLNFRTYDLKYTGALVWDAAPPTAGSNVSVIPYTTGSIISNTDGNIPTKGSFDAGFDAKISLNSALNLDVTINPNFSQVEVDRQVTNLSRFSIFFPEKRSFFLENADLFSDYGIRGIQPFYSRKIGIADDGTALTILGGVRLSGNLAPKTRIGLMSILINKKNSQPMQNYSAVSFDQRVFSRSTIKGYFFNRQSFMTDQQKIQTPLDEFGRNGGVDINLSNKTGVWSAWHGNHFSIKPGISKNAYYLNGGIGYQGRKFGFILHTDRVGENYYTDMGYVERIENYDLTRDTTIRIGFNDLYNNISYRITPKKGKINMHRMEVEYYIVFNTDGTLNELDREFKYSIMNKNTSRVSFNFQNQETNLKFPVKFVDDDAAVPLPADNYNYSNIEVDFSTDSRKNISINAGVQLGKFYTADYTQYSFQITVHKPPTFSSSLRFEYNKLVFPGIYGSENLFLIAPRIDFNFSTKLFWTTFLQYNTQSNNFNINSRFQWRYKPMSDFFLVYTDNYYSEPFLKNKNRAIVFKMNYWLNL